MVAEEYRRLLERSERRRVAQGCHPPHGGPHDRRDRRAARLRPPNRGPATGLDPPHPGGGFAVNWRHFWHKLRRVRTSTLWGQAQSLPPDGPFRDRHARHVPPERGTSFPDDAALTPATVTETGTVQTRKDIRPRSNRLVPNLTTPSVRSFPLNEPEPLDASQLDIDLMRRIDAVCRRFEADWRDGARRHSMTTWPTCPSEARRGLRAELGSPGARAAPVGGARCAPAAGRPHVPSPRRRHGRPWR